MLMGEWWWQRWEGGWQHVIVVGGSVITVCLLHFNNHVIYSCDITTTYGMELHIELWSCGSAVILFGYA